jgi:hypothetical protein
LAKQDKFEDTKRVIRSRNSKKDGQFNGQSENGQKDKQWSASKYKEQ